MPEFSPEQRNELAKSILKVRKIEKSSKPYRLDRDKYGYEYDLNFDTEKLFNYVSTLNSPAILDVGVGKGIAIKNMANSAVARLTKIKLHGTYLTRKILEKETKKGIKYFQTSVERLKGVPRNFYGAVLASHSVSYSDFPEHAVENLDQALVPGGVFIGQFGNAKVRGFNEKYADKFLVYFKSKQYFISPDSDTERLLVVKPPFNEKNVDRFLVNPFKKENAKE